MDWIWTGDYGKRQRELSRKRVPGTGTWFLEAVNFKEWVGGAEIHTIICHGPGMLLFRLC